MTVAVHRNAVATVGEEEVKFQVEFRHVFAGQLMGDGDAAGTSLCPNAVGEGIADGPDAAARAGAGFENGYVMAGLLQFQRGGESGHAGAENQDLLRRTTPFAGRAKQFKRVDLVNRPWVVATLGFII